MWKGLLYGRANICKHSSDMTSKSWIGLNIRFEYKARSASQERRLWGWDACENFFFFFLCDFLGFLAARFYILLYKLPSFPHQICCKSMKSSPKIRQNFWLILCKNQQNPGSCIPNVPNISNRKSLPYPLSPLGVKLLPFLKIWQEHRTQAKEGRENVRLPNQREKSWSGSTSHFVVQGTWRGKSSLVKQKRTVC